MSSYRTDKAEHQERVDKLNRKLKTIGRNLDCVVVDNDLNFKSLNNEPDEDTLNGSKLHLNGNGTRKLLKNINKVHPIIKNNNKSHTQHRAERQLSRPVTFRNQHAKEAPKRGCYFCGGKNHISKNCHFGQPVTCHECGESGHKSNNRFFHPGPVTRRR